MKSKTQLLQERKIQEFKEKFTYQDIESEANFLISENSERVESWLQEAFKEIESEAYKNGRQDAAIGIGQLIMKYRNV